jgi:hypothetical protein
MTHLKSVKLSTDFSRPTNWIDSTAHALTSDFLGGAPVVRLLLIAFSTSSA